MPKRCKTCGTLNDDQAVVCRLCSSQDLVFEEKKSGYEHKEYTPTPKTPETMHYINEKFSAIEHLEMIVNVLLVVLSIVGCIGMIASLVNGNLLLGLIMIPTIPFTIYIYWVMMMSYVEHLKNGEKSRKALEKIQDLLDQKK
jgi:hypothetical protein